MEFICAVKITNQYIKRKWKPLLFIALISQSLHLLFFHYNSGDLTFFLLEWFNAFEKMNLSTFLLSNYSNYTDPYNTFLYIAKLIQWLIAQWSGIQIADISMIKLITIPFELITAYVSMLIVHYYKKGDREKFLAFSLILIHPVLLINGSCWGQCDIIYTSMVFITFMFLLYEKYIPAVIFFGIAISFKFQAIFFSPLLLTYVFQKRIRWYQLGIIPAIYTLLNLPSLISGRPLLEVYLIYFYQAKNSSNALLSLNAPNFYQIFSNQQSMNFYSQVQILGTVLVIILSLIFAFFTSKENKNAQNQLFFMSIASLVFPFFLPSMHERYFFLAELSLVLLVIVNQKFWPAPLIVSTASILSYYNYYRMVSRTMDINSWPVKIGAVLNFIVLIVMLINWFQLTIPWTSIEKQLFVIKNKENQLQ